MNITLKLQWLAVASLGLVVLSCSSSKTASFDLLPAKPVSEDAEAERLRKMQLITVLDSQVSVIDNTTNQPTQIDAATLNRAIGDACQVVHDDCTKETNSCAWACTAKEYLCNAKTDLALTRPQGTTITVGKYIVPLQKESANAALAQYAMDYATNAAADFATVLDGAVGLGSVGCPAADQPFEGGTVAGSAAAGFADAFDTYKLLADTVVTAAVDTSDAELNSTASTALASQRAVRDWRLMAARAVGGTATELPFADNGAFCSRPPTTPDVRAAIAVFRDAAVSPYDVLSTTSTQDLVDGTLAEGSIRERLGEFYGRDNLTNGGSGAVEQQYNLNLAAFEDARASLKEEIIAFSRSESAMLSKRALPDGTLSTFSIYAATAAPPSRLPAAYYGALAHPTGDTNSGSVDGTFNVFVSGSHHGYSANYLGFISTAHKIVARGSALPENIRSAALGPLGMMLSSNELVANFYSVSTGDGDDLAQRVVVSGFSARDGIRVAIGEDQLRCAVQGSIEGGSPTSAPCGLRLRPFDTTTPVAPGSAFQSAAQLDGDLSISDPTRIYLLKPRVPPANPDDPYANPPIRGGYEALGGLTLSTTSGGGVLILKGSEERLAAILEPSREWCARPSTTCDGSNFDDRIPLENELTDDSNGIEDSWKHYLTIAKDAATHADALGNDYITSSLANAQNLSDNENRKEQQLESANSQLEQLQTVCGISSDTTTLLAQLHDATDTEGNVASTSGPCTSDEGCSEGFHCVLSNGNGICSVDLTAFLSTLVQQLGTSADSQRLLDCIGINTQTSIVPFVSLGDQPLCLWVNTTNPNLICQRNDGSPSAPGDCPRVLPPGALNPNGSKVTCSDVFADNTPGGTSVPPADQIAQSEPLNYFSMSTDAVNAGSATDLYALVRTLSPKNWSAPFDPSDPKKGNIKQKIISSNVLDRARLAPIINGFDWESRPGNYAAITFMGNALYETGSIAAGPATGRWPCADVDRPWSETNSPHPRKYDCGSVASRIEANAEMFAALSVVKGMHYFPGLEYEEEDGTFVVPYNTLAYYSGDSGCSGNVSQRQTIVQTDGSGVIQNTFDSGVGYESSSVLYSKDDLGCFHAANLHETPVYANSALFGMSNSWAANFNKDRTIGAGWILDYLNGTGSISDAADTLAWDNDSVIVPGTVDYNKKVSLRGGDLMMGMGLLAKAAGQPANIPLDPPPKVNSVDDLSYVSHYIQSVAQKIRDSSGSIIFSNMPGTVTDALRSESSNGSYPQFGGDMAVQISAARGALLRIRENGPLIANEVTQLGTDIDSLRILLQKSTIKKKIDHLQFLSTLSDRMTQCATAITGAAAQTAGTTDPLAAGAVGTAAAAGAAFTCANSLAQIGIASQLETLQGQDAQLDGELATADFGGKLSTHSTTLQTLGLNLAQAEEDLDAALATIENKRNQARSLLASAISAASFQAQHQAEVTTVMGNLADAKQKRYTVALRNAHHLAFLAKRAIEQRLGVSLATITEDYPLVDAPSKWESTACNFTGLDYTKLTKANPDAPTSFANGFIGDYVTKLENFVESYTLQNNFHQGTDTAVISLRDDLMGVRKPCSVAGPNLLFNAGQLDQGLKPGWGREGCPTEIVNDVVQPVADCAVMTPTADGPPFGDPSSAHSFGYALTFGSQATSTAAVVQSVKLQGGLYRFTWYSKESGKTAGGAGAGLVETQNGASAVRCTTGTGPCTIVEDDVDTATATTASWNRRYLEFTLDSPATVNVGFTKPGTGANSISVAAPMLEKLKDVGQDQALTPFVNTKDTLNEIQPVCEDSDGSMFRSTRWKRSCVKLCADGFADNCTTNNSKDYCFWEADFGFSQRDIQLGKVFNFSGFARGNFNYRIDSLGINFVGTGTKDCSNSGFPQTCFGSGSIPYTLTHSGPFFVRNFKGDDVETKIFDGNIEHARGLAAERYLTNPLSDTDNSLINQYLRTEFSGRPLDGNFVLRIWDENGVDFNSLQDVQIVLNYRYWTKFN